MTPSEDQAHDEIPFRVSVIAIPLLTHSNSAPTTRKSKSTSAIGMLTQRQSAVGTRTARWLRQCSIERAHRDQSGVARASCRVLSSRLTSVGSGALTVPTTRDKASLEGPDRHRVLRRAPRIYLVICLVRR